MHHPDTMLRLAETTRRDRFSSAERHRMITSVRQATRPAARRAARSTARAAASPERLVCPEPRRA